MALACFGGALAFDLNRPSYEPVVPIAFAEMEASLASSAHTDVDVLELGAGTGIFLESFIRYLRRTRREEARARNAGAERELEAASPPPPPRPAYLCRSTLSFLCTEPHAPYVAHMERKYAQLLGDYNEEVEAMLASDSCPTRNFPCKKPLALLKSLSRSKSLQHEACEAHQHSDSVRHARSDSPADSACGLSDSSGEGEGVSTSDEEPTLGLSTCCSQPQQQLQPQKPLPRVEARVQVAPAECLPLGDSQAKAVLCASSLHWFCNERAFREIHRVLIDNGVLAAVWVILDPDIPFWAHFKRAYGTPLYSQKGVPSSSSTDFAAIVRELSAAGTFPLAAPVSTDELRPQLELTPVSQLLDYLRTTSAYNELADSAKREAMLADMRAQMERDPDYDASADSVPHRFRYRYLFARISKH